MTRQGVFPFFPLGNNRLVFWYVSGMTDIFIFKFGGNDGGGGRRIPAYQILYPRGERRVAFGGGGGMTTSIFRLLSPFPFRLRNREEDGRLAFDLKARVCGIMAGDIFGCGGKEYFPPFRLSRFNLERGRRRRPKKKTFQWKEAC